MLDKQNPKWQKLMDEILSGMSEWREQHSKATFAEKAGFIKGKAPILSKLE